MASKRLAMSVIDEPWLAPPVLANLSDWALATSSSGLDSLSAGSFSAVRAALTRQSIVAWNSFSAAALGPSIT